MTSVTRELLAVKLTVAIAQHLSRTGELIQIYSDPQIFDGRLHS